MKQLLTLALFISTFLSVQAQVETKYYVHPRDARVHERRQCTRQPNPLYQRIYRSYSCWYASPQIPRPCAYRIY